MISLGGRFELVSRPGEGTTATLVLPLGGSAAGDVSSVESSARHSSFVSRTRKGTTLHEIRFTITSPQHFKRTRRFACSWQTIMQWCGKA